jgi:hypothetical protein
MFTVSRLVKSSLLVLLTATLATAAYAREGGGGGGGGGGGHNGANGPSGPSMQFHGSPVQSDARTVSGNGGPPVSKGPVAHPQPVRTIVVRDHRTTNFPDQPIPNNIAICSNGCVGEGGLASGTVPGPGNGYKPRDGQVRDHRTGGAGQVRDHRGSSGAVTVKFP